MAQYFWRGFRGVGVADPWINLDGRLNAAVGAAQFPALVNSYGGLNIRRLWPNVLANQPPWHIAGVDYRVGIPAGATLVDWQTIDQNTGANPIPGVSVSGINVNVTADNTTISNVDFTLHGGGFLNTGTFNNFTLTKSKAVWGSGFITINGATSVCAINSSNTTITYCDFDGGGPTFLFQTTANGATASGSLTIPVNGTVPAWIQNGVHVGICDITASNTYVTNGNGDSTTTVSSVTANSITLAVATTANIANGDSLAISGGNESTMISGQPMTGLTTLMYNYFHDFPQHVIEIGSGDASGNFKLIMKYNLIYNGASGNALAHLNYLQWGSLQVDQPQNDISFNTTYQPQINLSGGEGFQGYCNGGTNEPSGSLAFNTMRYASDGTGIAHLVSGKNWQAHDNYIDKGSSTTYFYGEANPGPTGNHYFNNVDMPTGNIVTI